MTSVTFRQACPVIAISLLAGAATYGMEKLLPHYSQDPNKEKFSETEMIAIASLVGSVAGILYNYATRQSLEDKLKNIDSQLTTIERNLAKPDLSNRFMLDLSNQFGKTQSELSKIVMEMRDSPKVAHVTSLSKIQNLKARIVSISSNLEAQTQKITDLVKTIKC